MQTTSLAREMWPLLATMRFFGWFPAQFGHTARNKLYLNNNIIFYCYVVLTLQVVPAFYYFGTGMQVVVDLESNKKMTAYIQLLSTFFFDLFISIFAALKCKQHIKLLNDFYDFQMSVSNVSVCRGHLSFGLKKFTRIVLLSIIFVTVSIMIGRPIILGVFPKFKLDLYVTISIINAYLLIGWWIAVMKAIQVSSRHLIYELQQLTEYNEDGKTGTLVGMVALEMRHSWLKLYHLLRSSGETLALPFFIFLSNTLINFLFVLYLLISPQKFRTIAFLILVAVPTYLYLHFICKFAHFAKKQVHADTIKALDIIKKLKTSKKIKEELMTFFLQLAKIRPDVNLCHYLNIDRTSISTLLASIISNLLVLYQLKIPGQEVEIEDLFDSSNI